MAVGRFFVFIEFQFFKNNFQNMLKYYGLDQYQPPNLDPDPEF